MEITVRVYTGEKADESTLRRRLRAAYLRAKEIQAMEPDAEIYIQEIRKEPPSHLPSALEVVREEEDA